MPASSPWARFSTERRLYGGPGSHHAWHWLASSSELLGPGGVGRVALLRGAEEHQPTQEEVCRSTVLKRASDS